MSPRSSSQPLSLETPDMSGEQIMTPSTSSWEDGNTRQEKLEFDDPKTTATDFGNLHLQREPDLSQATPIIEPPSMTGVNLTKFHCFSKLPTELRLQIWKATFPRPRVIALDCSTRGDPIGPFRLKWYELSSPPPTPVALHVNKESRQETSKTYKLCFESSGTEAGTTPKIYVNFTEDIFFITGRDGMLRVPEISSNIVAAGRAAFWGRGDSGQSYITVDSAQDFHKIQRLLIGPRCFKKQFLYRGRDPQPYYGLPNFLKELLIIKATFYRKMVKHPGIEFVEDAAEDEGEGDKNKNGEETGLTELHPADTYWIKCKRDIAHTFQDAKQANPDWNAPILRFGMDVVRTEMDN